MIGPSKTSVCKAVAWTDTGEWAQVYPSRCQLASSTWKPRLLFLLCFLSGIADFVSFDADDPWLYLPSRCRASRCSLRLVPGLGIGVPVLT